MRFRLFIIAILFATSSSLTAQNTFKGYTYTLDLTKVKNDQLQVQLITPELSVDEITFFMPKIIPGTYAIADYGRFVNDLQAFDKKGKKLAVERIETNGWKIRGAKRLAKITYWVDDSFDTEVEGPEIFWPAGTNIEEGKNFVINASGFFGYFEGMKELPFQVTYLRPKDFYGSTGLIPVQSGVPAKLEKTEKKGSGPAKFADVFRTAGYDELVDSPIMYARPDTAVIQVANAEVLIGSYAPGQQVNAKQIAETIREVLYAQSKYLGGELPVDKYAFIFYFTDQPVMSYGALEHSYSSFYYMPEMPISEMNQQLRDFAAHEFFHIVTPLTVHSEHIADFDFNDPKMSQHLWMYEGVTEYFASHVQVKYGLISPEEYINVLYEKMLTADQFIDDVPFTDISRFTLDKYHDQYYNVYQKGALIGMCLDIKLRKLSKGEYNLQQLMHDLSKKFGKEQAFQDDALFDIITSMTYPEIGEFFARHVGGAEPLPFGDVLADVGILYKDEERFEDYSLGITNADIGITEHEGKPRLQIASTANQNEMGKALGLKEGDIIVGMNDKTLPDLGPELGVFIQSQFQSLPEAKELSYTVLRENETGVIREVRLSAPVRKIEMVRRHMMQPDPNATEQQLELRRAWLSI